MLLDASIYGRKVSAVVVGTDFFFNWDSLYARLNSHSKAWGYKKKKHKKIKV